MKIAVLTDAHGNLPALDATLLAVEQESCDAIYHGGHAAGIGPYPAECVERRLSAGARCMLGNHEAYLRVHPPYLLPALGSFRSPSDQDHCTCNTTT